MEDNKRLNEISKAAGQLCVDAINTMLKTEDDVIRLLATETIFATAYIQGLCGKQFEKPGIIYDKTEKEE